MKGVFKKDPASLGLVNVFHMNSSLQLCSRLNMQSQLISLWVQKPGDREGGAYRIIKDKITTFNG